MEFFATCPMGFEHLLASEMRRLHMDRIRPLQGQVAFEGTIKDAYLLCLWSRLASRVVLVLGRFECTNSDELYSGASAICWEDHIVPESAFAVDASGTNAQLKNTRFSALRVKDAVVDRMARVGRQVEADPRNPNVHVVVRISRSRAMVGLDLAGSPLFTRAHERKGMRGGLRADYANALLTLAGCQNADASQSLIVLAHHPDTLLVEATLATAGYAPGLSRRQWGFFYLAQHDPKMWETLVEEARAQSLDASTLSVLAYRSFDKGTTSAKVMLRTLGVYANIIPVSSVHADEIKDSVLVADLSEVRPDETIQASSQLQQLALLTNELAPCATAVAARDLMSQAYLGQQSQTVMQSMLGRDALYLLGFEEMRHKNTRSVVKLDDHTSVPVLVQASEQFAARLKKVRKIRAKWARREDVSCYRVYDADLPDYAVTIDLFGGVNPKTGMPTEERWLQIYEYAPPKDVDPTVAQSRLMDVLSLAPKILEVPNENTFLRVRRRDKGGSQYANEARRGSAFTRPAKDGRVPLPRGAHLIDEGGLTFEVNFASRMDCGIFLDHRVTRGMLREMAKQTKGSKRFLNLFAYTGTATCYAADGGMHHTTTVDLSRPSLDWAQRNMARNGFVGKEHEYVQADVVQWVQEQRHTKNRWDLVFCDVPTFSNSSRMGRRSFDVQRDHAELLIGVSRLLTRSGTCVFSCNLRTFKPDIEKLAKAGVRIEDITAQTIPEDFARNKRVHHAYIVTRA